MSQDVPPDLEIPTLSQTLPSHLKTRPLEIPWITERAPKIDPGQPVVPPLAVEPAGHAQAEAPTAEPDIARWVTQVIQASTQAKATGDSPTQGDAPGLLADEVVERVQARLSHMLPNLVQEVMDEIHQSPASRGKPSGGEDMK